MRPISVYSKYAYYLQKYATVKKLNNILLNRYEQLSRKTLLKSKPYKITIDPGNFCNLRCPGCHTGIKHAEMIKPSFLKLENFKVIFDQMKDHALSIALYNWGEPFLNKQLFGMIEYATSGNVGTTVHSNFNVFNEQMAEDAVRSGLTHIYISIDGAGQQAYAQYRVNGEVDKVLENLELLLAVRKRHKSKYPIITWKYLIFDHNRHEVEMARKKAAEIGVDSFEVFTGYPKLTDIYDQAEAYKLGNLNQALGKKICGSLWSGIYVNSDGTVFPCSLAFRENESFGNVIHQPVSELWNNYAYMQSRKMFTYNMEEEKIPLPCRACKYFLSRQCAITQKN